MLKSKFAKTFIVGMSLTMMFTSAAFAKTDDDTVTIQIESIEAEATQAVEGVSDDILAKQREIDQYVFKDHMEEIREKGFSVTYTGPMEDYVEIGITPYNEENANYLYEIFGRDNVKVVEGQQAMLYDTGVAPDTPVSSSDQPAVSIDRQAASSDVVTDSLLAADTDIASTTAAETTALPESDSSPLLLYYALGGVLILGGSVMAIRKAKAR